MNVKSDNINLTAFVWPSTRASVGVWEVNVASCHSHHILDVAASLADDV